MPDFKQRDDGLTFFVKVVPRASKSGVAGVQAGALRVRVAAPPVDGAANAELVKTLAKAFGVPPRDVEIVSGHTAKLKRVRVKGVTAKVLERLETD
jgi:uncharacterized protein (TIGR00251 family)